MRDPQHGHLHTHAPPGFPTRKVSASSCAFAAILDDRTVPKPRVLDSPSVLRTASKDVGPKHLDEGFVFVRNPCVHKSSEEVVELRVTLK